MDMVLYLGAGGLDEASKLIRRYIKDLKVTDNHAN